MGNKKGFSFSIKHHKQDSIKYLIRLLLVQHDAKLSDYLTGKLMSVPGPQYFKAARSYALAAASSSSYAPVNICCLIN